MVRINGKCQGRTNQVIRLGPGEYVVELDGEETEPRNETVRVTPESNPDEILHIGFSSADKLVERFSPLYCRYNGFLLGQFLSLSFAEYGREKYLVRRSRMLEFFSEIGVDVIIPEEPLGLGSEAHSALLTKVLNEIGGLSRELTQFTLLGSLLIHHGLLAETDASTARDSLEEIEHIRQTYDLPKIELDRFIVKSDRPEPERVLSPSLVYLASAVTDLKVEQDTAFVIMPFKEPYDSYFRTFYRPSLEAAGYRAFRAWGGLSSEDYCDLLLKLIEKVGFVWADVSEYNYNVLYEVGAAHALDKLSLLVVRENFLESVPANIGHDAIVRYSPEADDWPRGAVSLMTLMISSLKLAAKKGHRLRVSPEGLVATLEHAGQLFRSMIVPREAFEARENGTQKLEEEDFAGAESSFDEAIQFGLDDAPTMLGRGLARFSLERYEKAETDFTSALESTTEDDVKTRQAAAFFRGSAREILENYSGAREDYDTAISLGYPEMSVYPRRAFVNIQMGNLEDARRDFERATEVAPEDPATKEMEGDLLSAEGQYDMAVERYNEILAIQPNANVDFARGLALLLAGKCEEAIHGYQCGLRNAAEDEIEWALRDLERKAKWIPEVDQCRVLLIDELRMRG
jgi:tetratricopeptide (TPR) repeat protein